MSSASNFDFSFAGLQSSGVLRTILEFLRDNERIFLSHTCPTTRVAVVPWIPSKTEYKTLTRPEILTELFSESNGVFSLGVPTNKRELHFNMAMLGQADMHEKGVPALQWFKVVTGLRPVLDTKRVLITKFLWNSNDNLSDRQMLVLKRRFEGGRDKRLMVDDRRHWNLIRDMLKTNSSISRFVFSSSSSDVGENCYADIFDLLSKRACTTEYLDISGRLTNLTAQSFHLLAWDLTGVMLRRLENEAMSGMLDLIISRPNEAKLTCLQFEGCNLDASVEEPMLNILDTLPITTLLFSKTTLPERGYSRVFSTLGNSTLEKLFFRKCDLSFSEVVQCLFLPTVSDSSLLELTLSYMHIPEEAAPALASCVETSNFLTTLSLEGCDLSPECLSGLVDGLEKSSLVKLNLGNNNIGCFAHKLFKNVVKSGFMRHLILDLCRLCKRASKDYKLAKLAYKKRHIELHVSLKDCEIVSNRKRKNQ